PLFLGAAYTGLDLNAGRGVDVVADGTDWQPDEPVDCVVCCECLEHAPDPDAVLANALAMLAPGGVCIVTAAGPTRAPHSGIDGGALREGECYTPITRDRFVRLPASYRLEGFQNDVEAGDIRALIRRGE